MCLTSLSQKNKGGGAETGYISSHNGKVYGHFRHGWIQELSCAQSLSSDLPMLASFLSKWQRRTWQIPATLRSTFFCMNSVKDWGKVLTDLAGVIIELITMARTICGSDGLGMGDMIHLRAREYDQLYPDHMVCRRASGSPKENLDSGQVWATDTCTVDPLPRFDSCFLPMPVLWSGQST